MSFILLQFGVAYSTHYVEICTIYPVNCYHNAQMKLWCCGNNSDISIGISSTDHIARFNLTSHR
jgi:hypothetical protein